MRVGGRSMIPLPAPLHFHSMPSSNSPFEIHLHGEVLLRAAVQFEQIQDALKPLWKYAGARSLADGAQSSYMGS